MMKTGQSVVGDQAWGLLVALYLSGIVVANALASKLMQVGPVVLTVGALAIPLVYLTTDLLNELYGPTATRMVVYMGLVANLVLVGLSQVAIVVPVATASGTATQEQFVAVFATTPRIVLASIVAYLSSSLVDVWIFHWLRRLTRERMFWLRKNGSTVVSQLLDSCLFVSVAFVGELPLKVLLGMAIGQYLVKMAAAPLGTPLSYGVLALMRRTSR